MSRVLYSWVGVAALLAVSFTAGCGDSSTSGTGETATEAAQTTTTAADQRLTSAQWAAYETSRAALRKANAAAAATLKKCSATSDSQNSAKLQACVGTTFSELTAAATDALSTLEGFKASVSGSCASSLNDLINYVGTFQASAAEMQRTIDSATLAGYPAASESLGLALNAGKSEAKTFESNCSPA